MDTLFTDEEREALSALQAPADLGRFKDVRPVDLITRDHQAFALLPELQTAADRFAEAVGRQFTRELGVLCRAEALQVEIVPYSHLPEIWGTPRFVYTLAIDDQKDGAALGIDSLLGGAYVVRQFGGSLSEVNEGDLGKPTPTEHRTVARLAKATVDSLGGSLSLVAPFRLSLDAQRSVLPSGSALLIFGVQVRFGEHTGRISAVLDTAAGSLRRVRPVTVSHRPDSGPFVPHLQRTHISLSSVLGRTGLSVREFLALQAGDLLTLDTPVDGAIELLIEGQPKYLGNPVLNRGQLSLNIVGRIKE